MESKYKFGLSKKMLLAIVILSTCICGITCLIGYQQHKKTISKLYNEHGYSVGDIILNNIDHDEVAKYASTWETDEYYDEMHAYIDEVATAANAKYIYMVVPSWDGRMRYIYDSTGGIFGDYDPISRYLNEVMDIYETGERNSSNYFTRTSPKYGKLTSSILPVKDNSGNTVALLLVDIAMDVIKSTLRNYVFTAIAVSLLFTIIFCLICYFYAKKSIVKPIKTIEYCLNDFANNAAITEELKEIVTKDELENLSDTIYSMEETVVKYIDKVTKITAEKERIGAELNVATQIQADMLPSIFPPFPERTEFDIYAMMDPAKEVGGDFYDFFMIDDTHVGLVMADVSGKGVPAALFMVISKTLLENRAKMNNISPAEVLAAVNNQLCENNKAEMFVTVWLGILDINTGIIKAANAGHEFPAICHEGKYELLKDKHGFVLAGMNNMKYKDYEIKLERGDSLFLYTDGVPEATNGNEELFGTDRMVEALNKVPNADCKETVLNVKKDVDLFVGNNEQFDDITILCLKYYGSKEDLNVIEVSANIDELNKVTDFIDNILENAECTVKSKMQINVAIDEIFSNIANYGYEENNDDGKVSVRTELADNKIFITFIDNGKQYNPLEKEDPDVTLSAEDRSIGGLGIFIVKKTMDSVNYQYLNKKNILTISKIIK